jgi:surfeit locus 1 family protein
LGRFRPGWLPTLFAIGATGILLALGTWQVQRLHWKEAWLAEQQARIEAPPLSLSEALAEGEGVVHRRVRTRGRFDTSQTILIHHVPREGREGSRVLSPLLLARGEAEAAGAPALLVDRGWIPHASVPGFLEEDRASEEVEVEGLLFPLELGPAEPSVTEERRVHWMRFDPGRHAAPLQAQLPYRIARVMVQRGAGGDPDALPIAGFEPPRSRVDHRSYAITWYSMAVVSVVVWVAFGIQRGRADLP